MFNSKFIFMAKIKEFISFMDGDVKYTLYRLRSRVEVHVSKDDEPLALFTFSLPKYGNCTFYDLFLLSVERFNQK